MNPQLLALIEEYLAAIQESLALFRTHRGMDAHMVMCWKQQEGLQQLGFIDSAETVRYFFHGIGCSVHLPKGPVDWDFGHGGRSDGFDGWRLARFAEARRARYRELTDDQVVDRLLVQAEMEGHVERFPDREYDRLFYLRAPAADLSKTLAADAGPV